MSGEDVPPLALGALADVLSRLDDTVHDRRLILVGGQALAFWSAQLAPFDPAVRAEPASSIDVDFQATIQDARAASQRLGARIYVPTMDVITPNTAVASFLDRDGYTRELDFIAQPLGLDADDVRETAFEVSLAVPDGTEVMFWVMHPERCLRSRVANLGLPEKRGPLAIGQLRVAVLIVRAFGRWLLDEGVPVRIVYRLNERIGELATRKPRSHVAYFEYGVDVLDALVVDERLAPVHLARRLPQIRRFAAERRAAYARRTNRNNECASRRSPQRFVLPERAPIPPGAPDTATVLDELREERF